MQMERWEGTIWDINATFNQLGFNCLQLLGMHCLTGSDTNSYPYSKSEVSAKKTLATGDFTGLYSVLGELDPSHAQLLEAGHIFFCALYGQPECTTMSDARYSM